MKLDGVSQSKIDEYFKIEGPGNPFESANAVKIFLIRPETSLAGGPGGLVFNPSEMQNMVNTGKGAAQDFVARLDPQDITWLV